MSSLRKQGPITTGVSCCAKAVKQRLSKSTPRRMGPCFRRDDDNDLGQHGENHGARFERQPQRECGVTGRITPTGVVGGFVHRQGCRNPYSKILLSVKGGYRALEQEPAGPFGGRDRSPLARRANQYSIGEFFCPVPFAKIYRLTRRANQFYDSRRPVPQRGERTSRTRGGMRWTRAAPLTNGATCGRRSRVVLTPRRWR
jgi:hypothetical protein